MPRASTSRICESITCRWFFKPQHAFPRCWVHALTRTCILSAADFFLERQVVLGSAEESRTQEFPDPCTKHPTITARYGYYFARPKLQPKLALQWTPGPLGLVGVSPLPLR